MRNYRRKGVRHDPDRRMTVVVRLRAEGMSLRQIAAQVAASHQTVANDLARWERERPNVTPLLSNPAVKNCPPRGEIRRPDLTPGSNVTPIRRTS